MIKAWISDHGNGDGETELWEGRWYNFIYQELSCTYLQTQFRSIRRKTTSYELPLR